MPSDPTPHISVIMSAYNSQCYLKESVESILNQTFTDFEFIIIDDGSTDYTCEILQEYANCDSRIVLVRNEMNIGLTKSLNKGLALARGKYIARQDSDDISYLERLEKQVEFLENHPEVVLLSTNIEYINAEGDYLSKERRETDPNLIAWYLLFYNYLGGHSQVMFRRKPILALGGYSEARRYSQDHELWTRLIELGDIVILPEVLLRWRRHNENISVKASLEQKACSLANTQQAIARLIGKELSLLEISNLIDFWLGPFPDVQYVGEIQAQMKCIYRMFLQQRFHQNSFKPDLPDRLCVLIGARYLQWLSTLSIWHAPLLKLKLSSYFFFWQPLEVFKYWLHRFQFALSNTSTSHTLTGNIENYYDQS